MSVFKLFIFLHVRRTNGSKIGQLLIAVTVLFTATSCLEYRQEIELDSATRGSFRIEAKIPEQLARAAEGKPEFANYLDPVKGAAAFKDKGVRIRKYRVYKDDDVRVVKIFGDIEDFKKVVSSGCLGAIKTSKEGEANRLTFVLGDATGTANSAEREKAFKGLKLHLVVETPEAVVATSGKKTGKREVEWTFDAAKDAEFLNKPPELFVDYK